MEFLPGLNPEADMSSKKAEASPKKRKPKPKQTEEEQLKLPIRGDQRVPKVDKEGRMDRFGPDDLGPDE